MRKGNKRVSIWCSPPGRSEAASELTAGHVSDGRLICSSMAAGAEAAASRADLASKARQSAVCRRTINAQTGLGQIVSAVLRPLSQRHLEY